MARGELRISTVDLQDEIGLDHVARHTVTLAAVLDRARDWFAQERGMLLEWEFVGRDILLRYSFPKVAANAPTTSAKPKRRIVLVT
jgi:hypothetical protein